MTRPLFLVDLDDTLFHTRHKIPAHLEPFRVASEATNGRHSWYTRHQSALVEWLFTAADTIPVTARSRESMSRCHIPAFSNAVLSNGGLVLGPDGQRDEEWHRRIVAGSTREAESMVAALENGLALGDVRGWVVEEAGIPLYVCFKSNDEGIEVLDTVRMAVSAVHPNLRAAQNGNNLSFSPAHVSKSAAVRYLLEERCIAGPDVSVFGMGDSVSDLPFMQLCHFKVIPTGSQIDLRVGACDAPDTRGIL